MCCRSLFVHLHFFFWPLCCLFYFDLRILITLLVSSNSSYLYTIIYWIMSNDGNVLFTKTYVIDIRQTFYNVRHLSDLYINISVYTIMIFKYKLMSLHYNINNFPKIRFNFNFYFICTFNLLVLFLRFFFLFGFFHFKFICIYNPVFCS
jgi:hypothetical protein